MNAVEVMAHDDDENPLQNSPQNPAKWHNLAFIGAYIERPMHTAHVIRAEGRVV